MVLTTEKEDYSIRASPPILLGEMGAPLPVLRVDVLEMRPPNEMMTSRTDGSLTHGLTTKKDRRMIKMMSRRMKMILSD